MGVAGCSASGDPGPDASPAAAARPLAVLVIDDPLMAQSLAQYQGQWKAETGGELQVRLAKAGQDLPAPKPDEDVVVFPSSLLGDLAAGKHLLALDRQLLTPHEAPWSDVFDLLRQREAAWGRDLYAVPLGSPVLVCYYRADLFARLKLRPPRTWDEYQKAAESLGNRSKPADAAPPADRPWSGTAEPLAPGWAAQVLLARAASYAKHPDHYSTLFDMATMAPRIDGPPFVRALEELAAAARLGPANPLGLDPDAVRAAFWRGECAMALTWPSGAGPEKAAPGVSCGVTALPGANAVYNPGEQQWSDLPRGEVARVPLLGIAGRMAGVARASSQPDAALRWIFWLAARQGTGPRTTANPATTLFRESDLATPEGRAAWVERAMTPEAAVQYGAALEETLRAPQWLVTLRVPGRAEYAAALDAAVRQAVQGKKTPDEALRDAASQWRAITARLGADRQRHAYRQSLGLD